MVLRWISPYLSLAVESLPSSGAFPLPPIEGISDVEKTRDVVHESTFVVSFLSLFKLFEAVVARDPWPWNWGIAHLTMCAITYGRLKWQENR